MTSQHKESCLATLRPIKSSVLLFVIAWAGTASAHGTVGAIVEPKTTVCVRFSYDDGEPIGYAKTTVHQPDSEQPYQSGATDRNGRFCLVPDGPGAWRITVNDGMGHQHRLTATVAEAGETAANRTSEQAVEKGPPDRISHALAGLGLIFGLTGMIGWYRARRRRQQPPSP